MKNVLLAFGFLLTYSLFGQDADLYLQEGSSTSSLNASKELGFEFTFHASNLGGTVGGAMKLAFINENNFVVGPSIRLQRNWYNNLGLKTNWSIYGGGVFAHYRMYEYLFAGAEFELLSTPFNNGFFSANRSWAPTLLIGAGFSRAFSDNFRLNAGIMYDVINSTNSPFRQGYFMRKENGAFIPVIYRIAFFIPI
jgi:hypothetical protein